MSEFQLPVFLVFIISLLISLVLNKYSLNFKKYFNHEKKDSEVRLSNLKVPTLGESLCLSHFFYQHAY